MCAVAGQYNFNTAPPDRSLLRRMSRRMKLRGPDGEGFYFHKQVGLAHRRLSILDLETGQQPMSSPSGNLWIVSNGEIYNYRELRKELESKGHRFKTKSDTEVILHLYEDHQERCLEKLEGMFAFCLFDKTRNALFLARDPFGIKPLHYYYDGNVFLFSSEIKGLLEYPKLDKALNGEALKQYFNFLCVLEPQCIFKKISKVPAGHYVWVDRNGVSVRQYYDPVFSSELERRPKASAAGLKDALAQSTHLALRSDVPLGIFLSGGVDSSAVAYLAARECPQIQSFSVTFRESPYDEGEYSRLMAAHLKIRHHEIEVTKDQAAAIVPKIAAYLDEPFADSSFIPTYFISQFARQRVKAVLTGDGNDELSAGYQCHVARSRHSKDAESLLYSPRKTIFAPDVLRELFSGKLKKSLVAHETNDDLKKKKKKMDGLTTLEKNLYLDLKYYLPSDILMKVDRISMMNSLEVRVPMLNRRYADYVCSLPPQMKLHAGRRKTLFRKVFENHLPRKILERKKMGFSIPMDIWIWGKGSFRELVYDTLSDSRTRTRGLFNWTFIQKMQREHDCLKRLHGYHLWTVFMFEMWLRNFGDKRTPLKLAV